MFQGQGRRFFVFASTRKNEIFSICPSDVWVFHIESISHPRFKRFLCFEWPELRRAKTGEVELSAAF